MTTTMEQQQLHQLFANHHERLLRKARWSVGNLQDAEDMVQEVFVRLIKIWPARGETVMNERAFVSTVLTNVIKDFHRAGDRRPKAAREAEEADAGSYIQPDPADDGVLDEVISGLPARQRDVIHLIYGEDMSPAMAAEELGISAKYCHRYHYLGLKKIREKLAMIEPRRIEEGRGER